MRNFRKTAAALLAFAALLAPALPAQAAEGAPAALPALPTAAECAQIAVADSGSSADDALAAFWGADRATLDGRTGRAALEAHARGERTQAFCVFSAPGEERAGYAIGAEPEGSAQRGLWFDCAERDGDDCAVWAEG